MTALTDLLTARAEALFASPLPTGSHPTPAQVSPAVAAAVRAHRGIHGCAIALAGAYGEHPETAAPRMRWALAVVHTLYTHPPAPWRPPHRLAPPHRPLAGLSQGAAP